MDEDTQVSDTEAVDENETVEDEATDAPSGEEQTSLEADETATEDKVPYSRFKEVVEERNELRGKAGSGEQKPQQEVAGQPQVANTPEVTAQLDQVKSQLKALGFVEKADLDTQLQQQREDAQVEKTLSELSDRYDGKDGKPKFNREKVLEFAIDKQIADLDTAYKSLNEKKLIDWYVKDATSKGGSFKSEASDGSGSSQVGTTDEDLKGAVAKGDKGALSAYLKRRISEAKK